MSMRFSAGVLALAVATGAAAADGMGDLLVKMSQAAKTSNYQGVVVYSGDDILETFRVIHRYADGSERERVQSLSGEPREVVNAGGKTICLLPKARRVTTEHPTPKGLFPGLTAEKVALLTRLYDFEDLGTQRVAGRSCHGIAITPRDQLRYGYEVWADEASSVPLKVDLIGHTGQMLEQMLFTEVDFPQSIPDSAFAIDGEAPPAPALAAPPPPAPPPAEAISLQGLPPGFRVLMRDERELPNGHGTVEHVLLSDGLSAISVFSTQQPSTTRPLQGVQQMGAVHAYGRVVGAWRITVVGEAPPETVKMVGDGVKPPAAPAAPVPTPEK
ncbi:MAG TPA: MucB/RseB C-terminal domain-containing protein [Nevskiaceae bacterium]|nr:MucB/RseB C-terminal domain-containing protein [Nevskiaceae bacterium]